MSTKDDALISRMLFGYFGDPNQGTEARQRMSAALRIARKAILEEAAQINDDQCRIIGARPGSSIHSALTGAADRMRFRAEQEHSP